MADESEELGDANKSKDGAASSRDEDDSGDGEMEGTDSEAEDDDEDEEDDEPKLKYARLTSILGPVYRNGDATSAFLVAGDKMVGLERGLL
jgi:vacuolar protein sorting-associated protein 41